MPYNFQCVNATYINAYAFPGGSIAVTRGILLKLDNEAELASLLGHELGHVNARHTAEQMTKGQLSSLLVSGLSIAVGTQRTGLGQLAQQLGMLSQSLLLSKYSRDNEREADFLGNQYMVKAGFSTKGFVGLMEMLQSLHRQHSGAANILFSTHPMSSERLNSAVQRQKEMYHSSIKHILNREKYMDSIASLRGKKRGIEFLQQGEKYLGKKEYDKARTTFKKSIKILKNDYTAHVLMSKCLMVMERPLEALLYADTAKTLYPEEAQALYIAGIANKELKKYNKAFRDFDKCDRVLPGNPQIKFYKGFCLDKLNKKQVAADNYVTYLKMINYKSNKYSNYAYNRLRKWGYVK
jgi:predicted Zn-dependent protease